MACVLKESVWSLSELKSERLHSNKVSTIVSLRNGYITDVMLWKHLIKIGRASCRERVLMSV